MSAITSLKVRHPRFAKLLSPLSIPGWAIAFWQFARGLWKLCANISTFQTGREIAMAAWGVINGPYGSLIVAAVGIAWLTAVAFWPTKPATAIAKPAAYSYRSATEVHLEIRELLFYPDPATYILDISFVHIYLLVSAVNRSSVARSITNWKLIVRVGSHDYGAKHIRVDTSLIIQRMGGLSLETNEAIPRPTWDELEDEGLQPGTPRTAWVAFALELPTRRGTAPHNAEFVLMAVDSMGIEHTVIRNPELYTATGKLIKPAASRVLAAT